MPLLAVELANIDDFRPDRPFENGIVLVRPNQAEGRAFVGHVRLHHLIGDPRQAFVPPEQHKDVEDPGRVVRPVSAARAAGKLAQLHPGRPQPREWPPLATPTSHSASATSAACAAPRSARIRGQERGRGFVDVQRTLANRKRAPSASASSVGPGFELRHRPCQQRLLGVGARASEQPARRAARRPPRGCNGRSNSRAS